MVNCSLSARRKTCTSLPRSNLNYVETSIPRLPSQNHMHTNTGSPTVLQTTIQKLISSVSVDLVPVEDLSAPTRRIDTPANVLGEFAALLRRLRPAVTELAQKNTNQGQTVVEDLKRELQSLTENREEAWSQDRPDDFFNAAAHTASSFEKHSRALVQTIADSALATACEVLGSVRETEVGAPIMSGGVALPGHIGGALRFGCVLGDSEWEEREHYNLKIGNVSGEYPLFYPGCCSRAVGGTGGADGIGFETGGKGGTGKGPVISAGRKRSYGDKISGRGRECEVGAGHERPKPISRQPALADSVDCVDEALTTALIPDQCRMEWIVLDSNLTEPESEFDLTPTPVLIKCKDELEITLEKILLANYQNRKNGTLLKRWGRVRTLWPSLGVD
ncbi:hypothetical protein DFH08DRAFT_991713 [Mycena albidolilacea]|uniref:Uncharacterized protein n=1 Tax=Mycena albidolilacea TaxID=1033008 RepID=A0AAD7EXB8_9AGAR|nr:hypothetical protein DFH08DRAFT_991713 [Mycena albidolilacea]